VKTLRLESTGNWISQEECFRLLGFTDLSRYEALDVIRERLQVAPFTTQVDHERQLQMIDEQLTRCRLGTKPVQVRREVQRVSEVVARYPEDGDLRWSLAALLENAGDTAGALEQWRALIDLLPQAALPRINLAKLLERLGRQAEALPLYSEGLRINPEYYPARYALGSLCLQMDRLPEAIHQLGLAVRQKPRSIGTRLTLSQAFIRANRQGDAEKELREVLRLDPGNATAQEQLKALGAIR
jgi:tetratricopeptide (TPR) repeat protein